MDKASVERLRFDRRLQRRPDWVEKADQEAYLASLPDVSEKMTTCAEEAKAAEAAAEANLAEVSEGPAAIATPASPSPTPPVVATAGDFSAPSPFGGLGRESGGD